MMRQTYESEVILYNLCKRNFCFRLLKDINNKIDKETNRIKVGGCLQENKCKKDCKCENETEINKNLDTNNLQHKMDYPIRKLIMI